MYKSTVFLDTFKSRAYLKQTRMCLLAKNRSTVKAVMVRMDAFAVPSQNQWITFLKLSITEHCSIILNTAQLYWALSNYTDSSKRLNTYWSSPSIELGRSRWIPEKCTEKDKKHPYSRHMVWCKNTRVKEWNCLDTDNTWSAAWLQEKL